MLTFDFISGDEFRASLEADYREMNACMDAKAWKAVHVLAGSIIEAVLLDYRISARYKNRSAEDILKMDLSDAITACKSERVLTQKAADLSSVVRQYRNLIHPGRIVRLDEKVDENSASIAQKLVEIIISEISKGKNETYGYTAEQILRKIEQDSSVITILTHLLNNVSEHEIRRLLLKILPQRYFELTDEEVIDESEYYWNRSASSSIEKSFRIAFDMASNEIKTEVAKKFIAILKEENEYKVTTYEVVFFKGTDLAYLAPDEQLLAKQHILARFAKDVNVDSALLQAMKGIGAYVAPNEMHDFVSSAVKAVLYNKDRKLKDAARDFIVNEYAIMSESQKEKVKSSLDSWVGFLKRRQQEAHAQTVEEVKAAVELDDLPF